MDRCPDCKRVSLAYDPVRSEWRCLWYSCRYARLANGATRTKKNRTDRTSNRAADSRGHKELEAYP